jgi:hypothetical protein
MKIYKEELDEQFIRKAWHSACHNWKGKIKEQVPDLHIGWFRINSGKAIIHINSHENVKPTLMEKINDSWMVIKDHERRRESAHSVFANPHNWRKINILTDGDDLVEAVIAICKQHGYFFDSRVESLNIDKGDIYFADIVHNIRKQVMKDGKWLLEPIKKTYIFENDTEFKEGDIAYILVAQSSGYVVTRWVLDGEVESWKLGSEAYHDEVAAIARKEELNWKEGDLYWCRDTILQEWVPKVARGEIGSFETLVGSLSFNYFRKFTKSSPFKKPVK